MLAIERCACPRSIQRCIGAASSDDVPQRYVGGGSAPPGWRIHGASKHWVGRCTTFATTSSVLTAVGRHGDPLLRISKFTPTITRLHSKRARSARRCSCGWRRYWAVGIEWLVRPLIFSPFAPRDQTIRGGLRTGSASTLRLRSASAW